MDNPDEHSASRYRRHHCRCAVCTEDHRRRYAAERAARARECVMVDGRPVAMNPAATHGTATTYSYYGCRCGPCTEANSDYVRKYRQLRESIRR